MIEPLKVKSVLVECLEDFPSLESRDYELVRCWYEDSEWDFEAGFKAWSTGRGRSALEVFWVESDSLFLLVSLVSASFCSSVKQEKKSSLRSASKSKSN